MKPCRHCSLQTPRMAGLLLLLTSCLAAWLEWTENAPSFRPGVASTKLSHVSEAGAKVFLKGWGTAIATNKSISMDPEPLIDAVYGDVTLHSSYTLREEPEGWQIPNILQSDVLRLEQDAALAPVLDLLVRCKAQIR